MIFERMKMCSKLWHYSKSSRNYRNIDCLASKSKWGSPRSHYFTTYFNKPNEDSEPKDLINSATVSEQF